MKILVTGGAGYLGSTMVPILVKGGHEVVVLDNFMYRQDHVVNVWPKKGVTAIHGDARDKVIVKKLMAKADAVFPLACLTGAPLCDQKPKEAEEIVIDALRLILKLRSPAQMIIYPTTNSGYGVGEKGKFCNEKTPLRPVSLYGKLKVQAEKELLDAKQAITLRLATAFGVSPRMRLDLLVNDFTYKAVKDKKIKLFEGHFKRNFVHVRDIAKAFVHALNRFDRLKNEPYNVGLSEANLSKLELCREIKKQVPEFEITEDKHGKDPDKRDYIVSNEKIEKTGFKADVSLADGIKELIKLYRSEDLKKTSYQVTNV